MACTGRPSIAYSTAGPTCDCPAPSAPHSSRRGRCTPAPAPHAKPPAAPLLLPGKYCSPGRLGPAWARGASGEAPVWLVHGAQQEAG